jgi:ferredoxin
MGSGQCCWYAPNTFDQDDETIAIVIDPDGDPAEAIQSAVGGCPTQAISVVSDADGSGDTQEE